MSVKERNRFVIAQNLQGVQAQLAAAVEKTDALYADPSSSITEREAADAKVLDLTNRVNKFKKDFTYELENKKEEINNFLFLELEKFGIWR